jgi:hypothetical protein
MNRRQLVATVPVALLAGCSGVGDPTPEPPTVRVVTEAGSATRVRSVGRDGVTFVTTVEVDNTANEVGGEVEAVEYVVSWSENEDGSWTELGPGEMDPFEIPAGGVVRQDAETTFDDAAAAGGLVTYVGTGGTAYLRVDGVTAVSVGPLGTDVAFERVITVEV